MRKGAGGNHDLTHICEDCGGTDFIGSGICTICGGKMLPLNELGGDDLIVDDDADEVGSAPGGLESFEDMAESELADDDDDKFDDL